MKALEEIKDNYSRELGYDDWNEVIYSESDPNILDKHFDEVIRKYALEVAKQALKNASENAFCFFEHKYDEFVVCEESILNENNIPEI